MLFEAPPSGISASSSALNAFIEQIKSMSVARKRENIVRTIIPAIAGQQDLKVVLNWQYSSSEI
jgi:hypothetical protein